jgi:hypothetical protein
MKTMNLNAAGVLELNAVEMREVEGGWVKELLAVALDIYENWDTYVAAFKEGYTAGQKAAK